MNITELLKESLPEETAKLVSETIAEVIQTKVNEAVVDSATQQAVQAQKYADDIENITAHYDVELKKASKKVLDLEKFYKDQSKIAVDKVLTAYDEKDRLEEHYVGQLEEAVEQFITETSKESVSKLQEQVAKYVVEKSELIEHAQKYAEQVRNDTLAEMQDLVKEATQEFIKENQEKFDDLDKMARYESTLNTIKESFEKIGLGLSEDLAFIQLEESVAEKQTEIEKLQVSLKDKEAQIYEHQKVAKFKELTENLSDLQREKLEVLSEAITADSIDTYSKTLGYIITSTVTKEEKAITESVVEKPLNTNKEISFITESAKSLNTDDERAKAIMAKMI